MDGSLNGWEWRVWERLRAAGTKKPLQFWWEGTRRISSMLRGTGHSGKGAWLWQANTQTSWVQCDALILLRGIKKVVEIMKQVVHSRKFCIRVNYSLVSVVFLIFSFHAGPGVTWQGWGKQVGVFPEVGFNWEWLFHCNRNQGQHQEENVMSQDQKNDDRMGKFGLWKSGMEWDTEIDEIKQHRARLWMAGRSMLGNSFLWTGNDSDEKSRWLKIQLSAVNEMVNLRWKNEYTLMMEECSTVWELGRGTGNLGRYLKLKLVDTPSLSAVKIWEKRTWLIQVTQLCGVKL